VCARARAAVGAEMLRALLPLVRVDAQFDSVDALTPERALLWRVYIELFGEDPYLPEVSTCALSAKLVSLSLSLSLFLCMCAGGPIRRDAARVRASAVRRRAATAAVPPARLGRRGGQTCARCCSAVRICGGVWLTDNTDCARAVLLLRALVTDVNEYAQHLLEAIAEIREPVRTHIKCMLD
jgi:hypothetical protein